MDRYNLQIANSLKDVYRSIHSNLRDLLNQFSANFTYDGNHNVIEIQTIICIITMNRVDFKLCQQCQKKQSQILRVAVIRLNSIVVYTFSVICYISLAGFKLFTCKYHLEIGLCSSLPWGRFYPILANLVVYKYNWLIRMGESGTDIRVVRAGHNFNREQGLPTVSTWGNLSL